MYTVTQLARHRGATPLLEACHTAAHCVRHGVIKKRGISGAITTLCDAIAASGTHPTSGLRALGVGPLDLIQSYFSGSSEGPPASKLPFMLWLHESSPRFHISPGLSAPCMRTSAALAVLQGDLKYKLVEQLCLGTTFRPVQCTHMPGGPRASTDLLLPRTAVGGSYQANVCFVAPVDEVREVLSHSDLTGLLRVGVLALVTGHSGTHWAPEFRVVPKLGMDRGRLVYVLPLADVHEYVFSYSCTLALDVLPQSPVDGIRAICASLAATAAIAPGQEALRAYLGLVPYE